MSSEEWRRWGGGRKEKEQIKCAGRGRRPVGEQNRDFALIEQKTCLKEEI